MGWVQLVPPVGSYLMIAALVGAEAVVAGFADCLGDRGELIAGGDVVCVGGDFGAAGDGEGVARFLSAGCERRVDELGGLGCGGSGACVTAESCERAGVAVRGIR